ncbi:NAD(P)H-binding protein [Streptomyces sp. NPDC050704]|uniref:NAD(P)H-binding protein n=1 Tax=Streptomyces sp. NPDC050704 TaxID=3157219 RepID=UPI0034476B79
MILVTGATGNVGAGVVRAVAAAGEPVRALSRAGASTGLPQGTEAVAGDLNRPETVRDALDGVRALFLMPGYEGQQAILADARAAGVERVVMLSGKSAELEGDDGDNAVTRYMRAAEAGGRASGLAWTFLRPVSFMANALSLADQIRKGDEVRVPFAGVRTADIDPYDIAQVAARALLAPGPEHEGRTYVLTGPQALLPADRIAILGEVLNRDLRTIALTDEETREALGAAFPAPYATAFLRFFADGILDESQVLPTVEEITGQAPRTFGDWAREHAAEF